MDKINPQQLLDENRSKYQKNNFIVKWLKRTVFIIKLFFMNLKTDPGKILKYPDPRLKRISVKVEKFDKELENTIKTMWVILKRQKWGQQLGIAAPQIGINQRIMIVLGQEMINPEWTPARTPTEDFTEGCYSLGEGNYYKVPRVKYGWAKWQNLKGEWMEEKLNDMKARVFMHELGHLDGICCNDIGEEVIKDGAKYTIKQE